MHIVVVAYTRYETDPRIQRQCESLARAGHRVVALGLGTNADRKIQRLGGVIAVRVVRGRYRGSSILRYVFAYGTFAIHCHRLLNRRRRGGRLDAVQTCNIPNAMGLLAWLQPRSVHWVHDVHDPEPELFISKFGNGPLYALLARMLVVIERCVAQRVSSLLWAVPPDSSVRARLGATASRLRHVRNAPDARIFPMLLPRRRGSRKLVYHGTIAARFGLDVAVRAVAMLRSAGVECTFDIIGEGDALPDVVTLVKELGLTSLVSVTGKMIPVWQVPAAVEDAAVGVVPIRRDSFIDLCLPTKILEYVRLGIPVVATATPFLEAQFPRDSLLLVEDGNIAAFASAIRRALDDGDGILAMAARAQSAPAARSWQEDEDGYLLAFGASARRAAEGDRILTGSDSLG